jgi:hypothetical protein
MRISRRSIWGFHSFGIIGLMLSTSGFPATVTVDPSDAGVPGSIYTTLLGAVDNHIGGDAWGNGVNDTIELVDSAVHLVSGLLDLRTFGDASTLTVRNRAGDIPVIAADPNSVPERLFDIRRPGAFFLDGLTILGPAGMSGAENGNETAIRVEADTPGEEVSVTLHNVVVTANDGSNQPVLDYSTTFPAGNAGTFPRALFHGGSAYAGKLSCSISHCAFAYTTDDDGCIQWGTAVDPGNTFTPPTRNLTVDHTLIANTLGTSLRLRSLSSESTVLINESFFVLLSGFGGARSLFFTGQGPLSPMIQVHDSIFDNTGGSLPINADLGFGGGFTGTLDLQRVTIRRPGADVIFMEKQSNGSGNYILRDFVASGNVDSVLYLDPAITPALLTVECVAASSGARATQSTAVKNAFAALYGGTGVLKTDPQIANSNATTVVPNLREWVSTDNDLFDVANLVFADKATDGGPLSGGAEFIGGPEPTPTPTPPPPSSTVDWVLYQ